MKYVTECLVWACLFGAPYAACAQSFVEFNGISKLGAVAAVFGKQEGLIFPPSVMRPGIADNRSLQLQGAETSVCGTSGLPSRSNIKSSANLNTRPFLFELELTTEIFVQGGVSAQEKRVSVPFGGGICLPSNLMETSAAGQASSGATVEIKFNEDTIPQDYWLDVEYTFKNSSERRDLILRGPRGESLVPTSEEPILIRVNPNTSWFLEAALDQSADGTGPCCGKTQESSLRLTLGIRPAGNIVGQKASSRQVDRTNQFDAVGLLITRNLKGEPVPICVATVIGRRSVLTSALCLARVGVKGPTDERPLWFVQNVSIQAGLRRGAHPVIGWSTSSDGRRHSQATADEHSGYFGEIGQQLAVLEVDADLGVGVAVHDGRTPFRALLGQAQKTGAVVSYGLPTTLTSDVEGGTGMWMRNLSDVRIMNDTSANELIVVASAPQCGADAGSPVFVDAGNDVRLLVGVLVSGAPDCQHKSGVRTERYVDWLRVQLGVKKP